LPIHMNAGCPGLWGALFEGGEIMDADIIAGCGYDAFIPEMFQLFVDAFAGHAQRISQLLLGYLQIIFIFLIGRLLFGELDELLGKPRR
jgi:hypothetical protein